MKKVFAILLAAVLSLSVIGEIIPYIPSLFSAAEEINEYVAFYTSFEQGALKGETYRGYPMRGVYDSNKAQNVRSITPNDWFMSMMESAEGSTPKISSRGPENLVDNDAISTYMTEAEFPITVRYNMLEPVCATFYSITSTNNYNNNAPMDWTIEASNNGEEWTVLSTVEGQSFTKRTQTKKYTIENDKYYRYYRMVITKKAGGETSGTLQFSDFILRDNDITSANITSAALLPEVVVGGPFKTYLGQLNLPWKGEKSLRVTGEHLGTDRAYSNAYLFRGLNIPVTEYTRFQYLVVPDFVDNGGDDTDITNYDYDYTSHYIALDIQFTDGTYLSELGAVDRNGNSISARAQGEEKVLFTRNWNEIETVVGDVAAGKVIDSILVAYDKPSSATEKPANILAYFDDVKIYDVAPLHYDTPVEYTDSRRGSNDYGAQTNRGQTYPTTCVPNGFNIWSPSTGDGGRKIYNFHPSDQIRHFMITHQASIHLFDYACFMFMPNTNIDDPTKGGFGCETRKSDFDHEDEIAQANYYSVVLAEGGPASGVRVEMAPTDHAGIVRFTFPEDSENVNIILDSICSYTGLDEMYQYMEFEFGEDGKSFSAFIDYGSTMWNCYYPRMYIYGEFDLDTEGRFSSRSANRDIYLAEFPRGTTEVNLKMATSYMSVDQAKKNLALEISDRDTIESIREKTAVLWNDILDTVSVVDATEEEMIALYSNLYKMYVFPTNFNENVGTAENPDIKHVDIYASTKETPVIKDGIMYTTNGFWDTYRTAWAGYALLTPDKAGKLIDGILTHFDESDWIGRWLNPGAVNSMAGTSSDVIFGDAAVKGIEFDKEKAFLAALRNSATPAEGVFGRVNNETSVFYGLNAGNLCWHLESCLNDFGIAQLAKTLGYEAEYKYYLDRSKDYMNVFYDEVEFFVNRYYDGRWKSTPENFDPMQWNGYIETNAWGTAFSVPHDGSGLAQLYGGKDKLAAKLDALFVQDNSWQAGHWQHEMYEARELRMGQYQHSNQPSHHIIYMYSYADQPYKVQERTREVLRRVYSGNRLGQGYMGDEDNGEMSAWYILSALGFYPCSMGSGEYFITSPLYKEYTLHLESGDINVKAINNSTENVYIQSMTIDGEYYNKAFITHEKLLSAKEIVFVMGSEPSDWATELDSAPTSVTKNREILGTSEDYSDKATKTYSKITSASNLFNNNSKNVAMVDGTGVINFSFEEAKTVEMITVASGAAKGQSFGIKLYGSDSGEEGSYVELISEKNAEYLWKYYVRPFKVDNPAAYKYYRLELSGEGSFGIGEVELLGGFHEYIEAVAGDMDADCKITVADALAVLRSAVGFFEMREGDEIADMDGDGILTVSDALIILRKVAGLTA